ncbi:hypothetical protein [Methanobrevibacter sp.]|uniref:hypothetical protein n=1 Tax=Methanobrevibacter sp. TaxID=66852 RepID=UPI00386DBDC4
MNCCNCNKELDNEIIAFCEKCEEYYCMKCTKGHNHHGLSFFEYKNNEKYLIPIGFTAAGPNDRHTQFYYEKEWILNNLGCEHVLKKLNEGLPVFNCENNKFYCDQCFHDSKLKYIRPLMKSEDGIIQSLIPYKFHPFNLDFNFSCDDGTKGKSINSRISIKNNKKNDITDIKIVIESYAADPLPKNKSYDMYLDKIYPYYILCKELHHDLIKSEGILTIDIKLDIPLDGEIKKGQFLKEYYDDGTTNNYCENGLLNIPKELMIYAYFTYKTCSGNTFYSYVKTDIINIK